MKFYNEIIEKLRNGEPFKFSRWGDGEWGCMYGWTGKNRDGNEYLPALREELMRIINSEPDYYMGIQPGVLVDVGRGYCPDLRAYVFETLFQHPSINLVNGDILHQAAEFGYLRKFTDALKDRNVFYIGADYFGALPYPVIEIPPRNSFLANEEILHKINGAAWHRGFTKLVFLVSAAMNSNVIIDQLPDDCTAIDIGSVFDPYLGRPRASYQHKMNVTLKDLWD